MNKKQLVQAVAKQTGVSQKDVNKVIYGTTEVISDTISTGDIVKLIGFGSFKKSHRVARKGINPSTGKPITVKARNLPTFKAGGILKAAVNAK